LSDRELGVNGWDFLLGGLETTRNAIASGLLEFSQQPEQWHRLVGDPGLLGTAVDEILRWTSPLTHSMRTTTRDTELRGKKIQEGDRVVIWIPSVNRDEDAFPDADRFDLARKPNYHLAFGYGEHYCLGVHLARLELKVMLEEMVHSLRSFEVTGTPQWIRSNVFSGLKHLPVRLTSSDVT
jgi:cytochrome P450